MKICATCDSSVSKRHTLCYKCFVLYKDYKDTQWLKELAKAEIKQDHIDMIESLSVDAMYSLPTDLEGGLVKRSVGRPSTDWRIVNKVLEVYDDSVAREKLGLGKRKSLRAIEKELGNVNFLTVRKILQRYRSES